MPATGHDPADIDLGSPLHGASAWEMKMHAHLTHHLVHEGELLREYAAIARDSQSPAFQYLANLILEDEIRHHRLLAELARSIATSASADGSPSPIPRLGDLSDDSDAVLDATARLLANERDDERSLAALAKELRDYKDTTMWSLLVEVIRHDNAKHQTILRFIEQHAAPRRG